LVRQTPTSARLVLRREPDGTLVGIRKPLAAHEQPIVRTYLAVENIQQAVKKAERWLPMPRLGKESRGPLQS
jgi:hypothetical protein